MTIIAAMNRFVLLPYRSNTPLRHSLVQCSQHGPNIRHQRASIIESLTHPNNATPDFAASSGAALLTVTLLLRRRRHGLLDKIHRVLGVFGVSYDRSTHDRGIHAFAYAHSVAQPRKGDGRNGVARHLVEFPFGHSARQTCFRRFPKLVNMERKGAAVEAHFERSRALRGAIEWKHPQRLVGLLNRFSDLLAHDTVYGIITGCDGQGRPSKSGITAG